MEASGHPRMIIDKGLATLEADGGHGRGFIDACNYEGVLEYELRFNDEKIDNHTAQTKEQTPRRWFQ